MKRSAATITVCSLHDSNGEHTSTISVPNNPRRLHCERGRHLILLHISQRIMRNSAEIQPPLSGVPLSGAFIKLSFQVYSRILDPEYRCQLKDNVFAFQLSSLTQIQKWRNNGQILAQL